MQLFLNFVRMKKIFIAVSILLLASCAEVMHIVQSTTLPAPLTETEVVNGLKEALITGASNSSKIL